jgi:hypothetical protein
MFILNAIPLLLLARMLDGFSRMSALEPALDGGDGASGLRDRRLLRDALPLAASQRGDADATSRVVRRRQTCDVRHHLPRSRSLLAHGDCRRSVGQSGGARAACLLVGSVAIRHARRRQ